MAHLFAMKNDIYLEQGNIPACGFPILNPCPTMLHLYYIAYLNICQITIYIIFLFRIPVILLAIAMQLYATVISPIAMS